jgi:hypothetical protein
VQSLKLRLTGQAAQGLATLLPSDGICIRYSATMEPLLSLRLHLSPSTAMSQMDLPLGLPFSSFRMER